MRILRKLRLLGVAVLPAARRLGLAADAQAPKKGGVLAYRQPRRAADARCPLDPRRP